MNTEQLTAIISQAVAAAVSAALNNQPTEMEAITQIKADIVDKVWENTEHDGEMIDIISRHVQRMENGFKYVHYFTDLTVKKEFIQYIRTMDQNDTVVLPFTCDHKTPSSGHLHAHVIVGTRDEEGVRRKMSHFARWLKTNHNKTITKKTNRVAINNWVHLINVILYIQTVEGNSKNKAFNHTAHKYKNIIFPTRAEALLFKRGPIVEKWPTFLDEERDFAQQNNKRKTPYQAQYKKQKRARRISISSYNSDSDSE